jgi:hypothetical protein
VPTGLVVHHDQLAVSLVDAVHPPLRNNPLGRRGNPALHPHGIKVGIQLVDVSGHPVLRAATKVRGLRLVGKTLPRPVRGH